MHAMPARQPSDPIQQRIQNRLLERERDEKEEKELQELEREKELEKSGKPGSHTPHTEGGLRRTAEALHKSPYNMITQMKASNPSMKVVVKRRESSHQIASPIPAM